MLLVTPSGFGGLVLRARDAWLQKVAAERGIDAPGFTRARLDAAEATVASTAATSAAAADAAAAAEAAAVPSPAAEPEPAPR